MLRNTQDAEDIVQTLFIDLIAAERVDVGLPYLYRAVTRRCLNRLRDGRRRRQLLEQHGRALVTLHGDLDERVITLDLLTQLVSELPEPLADVFVYRFLDQMTQDQVAEMTGTSRKTVGQRLVRIRSALQALVEAEP